MKDREVITVNTFTTIKYLHRETTSLAETKADIQAVVKINKSAELYRKWQRNNVIRGGCG